MATLDFHTEDPGNGSSSSLSDDWWDDRSSTSKPLTQPIPSTASWLLVSFLGALIASTIIGNLLVCLAVILVRKLRRPQNYLLVSLAMSDIGVALVVMPFAIVNEFHQNQWPLDPALCDLFVSADVLCCTASILNLCGISVDRYRAITSPLEYSAKSSPKRMLAVIFVVWLGSACVSVPPLLLLGNEHHDPDDPSIPICTVSQNFWYQIYATMVSFYVPLLVMVVVYVKILRVVAEKKKEMSWKLRPAPLPAQSPRTHQNAVLLQTKSSVSVNRQNGGLTKSAHTHRLKKDKVVMSLREHKASTTLGIIMTAFIVCWLPFFALALVRPFFTIYDIDIPGWVSSLFLWLGYTNSALNPVIYATLNRDFRKPFKEILCFRCSTLDSLMRREFYNHQFGEDTENIRQPKLEETQMPTPL